MHRSYVPTPLQPGELRIEGPEALHLLNVVRGRAGDLIQVFDGRGGMALATIIATHKKWFAVQINDVQQSPPETRPLVLATAVPKGPRCDWLVEKAAELGVTCWQPLVTERSVVDPRDSKLDRLRQVVISACKQCGRNRLMDIAPLATWEQFLTAFPNETPFLIATPDGPPWAEVVQSVAPGAIAIGPEGGWTGSELELAQQHGAQSVSLGPAILRIETAAAAVAAAWRLHV
jgi:16S rRNA (uracil1498-N3)-methyltransferase